MLISKYQTLKLYDNLVKLALKGAQDLPNNICSFFESENHYEACVIFKLNQDNSLKVIGKSGNVKRAYEINSVFDCPACKSLTVKPTSFNFSTQPGCELEATDYVMYEGCLFINLNESGSVLVKLAKKTPFTQNEKEELEILAGLLQNIFKIWLGNGQNNNSSLSKLISDISHELRTPTNSIMGFASLLNEDNLSPSQAEYVNTLKENAYNHLSLLNDLIDLAKFESNQAKELKVSVNYKHFITEIIKSFQDKFPLKEIDFINLFEGDFPEIFKIDTQKLRYILINLINYSIRLTEKGKITLTSTLENQNKLHIKLSDSSEGLSSVKVKEFFQPFAIFDLAKYKFGNITGLGLTLAKKYVELLNGEIDIYSAPGKGTTYNLKLGVDVMNPIETQLSSLPKPGKKNRVLVIEDDYATSKLLSNYLNKWGYEPVIVNSAEQTLNSIEKENFLAILLDIVLPDSNGFDLMKRIRSHPNSKRTPVIVCSIEAEEQKAFLMGAVEYFVKPIQYNFLVEVLQSYKLKRDSNILIVDDDVPTLNLIKEAVQQAGFTPIAEPVSAKVMELIEDKELDLAIVDLEMPTMNGFELIKAIKENPKFSKLPIVIYTGKENYKEDLKEIDGLFEHLLEKRSSNIEDLADTVTAMINKFDEPASPEEVAKEKDKDTVKILLAEDYKHSQIIVTRLLKKNNFNHIVVVENGAEALEQVKKQKFDLILMDMQMPVMNGFEAMEKIRMIPEYKETPIIALTAFAMKGDREKCLDAGATDYIPKPIDSQEFVNRVKHYTENAVTLA
ncbi:MAG: response regulator [Ignavibacteriaceae bacterium]|nr:response regulator [Ignavibacteriaceae bacterium]